MFRDDVRAAVRSLGRARGLTAVLLVSLGIGTGANATVYSVVDALLFRAPDGISRPERLVSIYTSEYDGSPFGLSSTPDYTAVAGATRIFQAVAAADDRHTGNVRLGDYIEATRITAVTGNFFSTLGIPPHLGRTIGPTDAAASLPGAVISFAIWEAAGRPEIDSLTLTALGREYAVVGVAPRRFRGLQAARLSDVWIPLNNESTDRARGDRRLTVIGRLRSGISAADADEELRRLSERLAAEFPSTNRGTQADPEEPRRIGALSYSPLQPEAGAQASMIAAAVAGAVVMLLLSACINAGNLLLSRGFARRRELAVKMALGATRPRLVRQLLAESLLTSIGGAALGLLFAAWTTRIIPSLFSPDHAAMLDMSLQRGVIIATVVFAIAAGAAFGVAPAFHATSSPAVTALRADSGGVSDGGGRRLRGVLVAAQIALSTVLLLAAGLLITGLRAVLNADGSFPARNVALVALDNPGLYVDTQRGIAFQRTLVEQLRKTPGVQAVGWAATAPLVRATRTVFRIEAGAADVTDAIELDVNVVSATYFDTIGLRLVEGRRFDESDQVLSAPVVIVDEQLARRHFGAVAERQYLLDEGGTRHQIVGVVRGRRFRTLQDSPRPTVYFPVTQRYVAQGNLLIVTRGDAEPLLPTLPAMMRRIDDEVKITRVITFEQHLSEVLAIDRLTTNLVGVCGALALVMAVIGVYGVMNDVVRRRTREIGLRVALGAARTQVARVVFREALYVSIFGLAAGTALAVIAEYILGVFVSGLPGWDAVTLGAPAALLALIVAAAAVLPLRRALSVSAAVALRAE